MTPRAAAAGGLTPCHAAGGARASRRLAREGAVHHLAASLPGDGLRDGDDVMARRTFQPRAEVRQDAPGHGRCRPRAEGVRDGEVPLGPGELFVRHQARELGRTRNPVQAPWRRRWQASPRMREGR